MNVNTKCTTPVEREARKALRSAMRGLALARAVDATRLSDDVRLQRENLIRGFERIERAFDEAKTEAQLLDALRLTELLTGGFDEMEASQ